MLPELDSLGPAIEAHFYTRNICTIKKLNARIFDDKKERKMTMSTRLRMAGDIRFSSSFKGTR